MDIKELQNGSDIRGIAINTLDEKINLSAETAKKIGYAFAYWYSQSHPSTFGINHIGIGMDSRLTGPTLKKAIISGLISYGCRVSDFGLATTPAMFMSTQFQETNCDAAIMITASHLPFNRNGMKFFTRAGGLEKNDITRILEIASETDILETAQSDLIVQKDLISIYANYILDIIRKGTNSEYPLKGQKIVVDAGNGSGGFFASKILEKLGADTSGSLYLEPDGNFPNHEPNPENLEAIKAIRNQILQFNADLGIIFDTDVDRAALIHANGKAINRNILIALASAIVLEEHPGSTIVTDSVTSEGLTQFIHSKGGVHHRFKRGYRNVINEGIKLNNEGKDCWLAIETSGHGALRENYFLDDGAYLAAKILIKHAQLIRNKQNITNIIHELKEPKEAKEYRITIKDSNFISYGQKVIEELEIFVSEQKGWMPAKTNYEGYRVICSPENGNGWFLLRLSLHDPVLALNVESESQNGIPFIMNLLHNFLKNYTQLEMSSLI